MHAHTKEVSACGQSTAVEMVEAYAAVGFAGIVFTEILDGIEVYNHCNRPEENIKATELCERHGLFPVSGSDTHSASLCGKAGLAFENRIVDGKDLAKALFAGVGTLIINGEIS